MTMLAAGPVSTAMRWLAPTLIACVCAIASSATANATWNQAEFDACTTRADTAWLEGDISSADHLYFYELCCGRSGGAWTPHGNQGLGVWRPRPRRQHAVGSAVGGSQPGRACRTTPAIASVVPHLQSDADQAPAKIAKREADSHADARRASRLRHGESNDDHA